MKKIKIDEDEMLRKCCVLLSEHFDTVQILVSGLNQDGDTYFNQKGSGNAFARRAMMSYAINMNTADTLSDSLKDSLKIKGDEE